jgi:hypothetical protein
MGSRSVGSISVSAAGTGGRWHRSEEAHTEQTLEPTHGERVRHRQLSETDPETPQHPALFQQLVDADVVLGVPARGEQDQPGRAGGGEVGAVAVAGVLAKPGQRGPEERNPLRLGHRDLVPERDVV